MLLEETKAAEDQLISEMESMANDPLAWVKFSFEWGKGELADYTGPEIWQEKILGEIRDGLKTPNQVILESVASGHGVGKSCLVAWIILWGLSTRSDTRIIVTANTDAQLRTKTWPECQKWLRLFICQHWFTFTATAIYSKDATHEKTWRADIIPWSENKTESFAGLHNKGKRIIVIFDEASAIPNVIWEVTEGALTDKDTEIIWAAFGNPTRNTGRFRDCFGKNRHRWLNHRVDSRTVKITNKDQIDKWIADYGEDSDFVKVRVKGDFPSVGDRQFISSDFVTNARGRHLRLEQYDFAATVIGVDPGWSTAEGVIYLRQGLMSKKLMVYRGIKDDFTVAGYVAKFEDDYQADGVFIDLGYGTGIYSAGKQMGRNWQLVSFGEASTDKGYLNKRADMWRQMRDWLKEGGAIEDDPVINDQLIGPEYGVVATGPNSGKVFLESKEDMLKRGVESPDRADALALTFAAPVMNKSQKQFNKLSLSSMNHDVLSRNNQDQQIEYNPLSDLAQVPKTANWKELMTRR